MLNVIFSTEKEKNKVNSYKSFFDGEKIIVSDFYPFLWFFRGAIVKGVGLFLKNNGQKFMTCLVCLIKLFILE